jgi:hypothetical protein
MKEDQKLIQNVSREIHHIGVHEITPNARRNFVCRHRQKG